MMKGDAAAAALAAKMVEDTVSKTLLMGAEQVKLPLALGVSCRTKQLVSRVPVTSSQPPVEELWKQSPPHTQVLVLLLTVMSSRIPEKSEREG